MKRVTTIYDIDISDTIRNKIYNKYHTMVLFDIWKIVVTRTSSKRATGFTELEPAFEKLGYILPKNAEEASIVLRFLTTHSNDKDVKIWEAYLSSPYTTREIAELYKVSCGGIRAVVDRVWRTINMELVYIRELHDNTKNLKKCNILVLKLPKRVNNILHDANILTVEQLIQYQLKGDLLSIYGINESSETLIIQKLNEFRDTYDIKVSLIKNSKKREVRKDSATSNIFNTCSDVTTDDKQHNDGSDLNMRQLLGCRIASLGLHHNTAQSLTTYGDIVSVGELQKLVDSDGLKTIYGIGLTKEQEIQKMLLDFLYAHTLLFNGIDPSTNSIFKVGDVAIYADQHGLVTTALVINVYDRNSNFSEYHTEYTMMSIIPVSNIDIIPDSKYFQSFNHPSEQFSGIVPNLNGREVFSLDEFQDRYTGECRYYTDNDPHPFVVKLGHVSHDTVIKMLQCQQ